MSRRTHSKMRVLFLSLVTVTVSLVENASIANYSTLYKQKLLEELKQMMTNNIDKLYTYNKLNDTALEAASEQNALNQTDILSNDKRSTGIPYRERRWLCNAGTDWKELDEGFYPRFVKETICHQATCFNGYFGCQPYTYPIRVLSSRSHNETRDLNIPRVLRNEWKFSTIDIAVGCECGIIHW